MGTKKPVHRTQSDGDPACGGKRIADLLQGQVGLLGNQLQHPRAVLAQPGATITAHRARARMAFSPPALPPSAMKPITRSLRSCEYGAGISPPMASSSLSLANQQGPENPSSLRVYLIGNRSNSGWLATPISSPVRAA